MTEAYPLQWLMAGREPVTVRPHTSEKPPTTTPPDWKKPWREPDRLDSPRPHAYLTLLNVAYEEARRELGLAAVTLREERSLPDRTNWRRPLPRPIVLPDVPADTLDALAWSDEEADDPALHRFWILVVFEQTRPGLEGFVLSGTTRLGGSRGSNSAIRQG